MNWISDYVPSKIKGLFTRVGDQAKVRQVTVQPVFQLHGPLNERGNIQAALFAGAAGNAPPVTQFPVQLRRFRRALGAAGIEQEHPGDTEFGAFLDSPVDMVGAPESLDDRGPQRGFAC